MSEIDEVKARLDVADLIGQSVPLKRAGRTLKGLCPFHAEKTPSFVVWPDEGNWKCFGCGEGGSGIDFLMKRESLEFGEALRILAEKTGVELPSRQSRDPQHEEANQRLYQALQAAALYYHGLLQGRSGSAARVYLGRRGLSPETMGSYLLGFAPQHSGALERHLMTAGFTADELEAAGLVGQGEHGRFDWFRN